MKYFAHGDVRLLRRIIFWGVVFWFVWACLLRPVSPRIGPTPARLGDGWGVGSLQQAGFDSSRLEGVATSLFEDRFNVHALLIERHGRLVAEYYQGGKDRSVYAWISTRRRFGPNDLHDVRSIGKSITSLIYGIALEEGHVPKVDASIEEAFPERNGRRTFAHSAMRMEDVLNMASGLQWQEGKPGLNDELRLFWKTDLVGYVLSHPTVSAPNAQFNYNGGCTVLLSELIRRGTGQSLEHYAQAKVFRPMQIEHWEWVHDLHGRAMAFNGLRLRPRDLLKFGRLVLNQGVWQGQQIVPRTWIAQSMASRFATDVRDYTYGYQWWHGKATWQGKRIDWHGGLGNGGQRLYLIPALDMTVVTAAGAYDELPTAIRVNDLIQEIVDTVQP